MKTVWFDGAGGVEVVGVREAADPSPGRGEVLVRVRAAGMNRADLLQRMGLYPPPPGTRPEMPGLELAGEVAALGPGVTGFSVGDRVMAIASGEAQAELAVVHERMLMRVPPSLDDAEAGAAPEAFVTAHDALFTQGGLRPGWPVLIHAVGSGVGTAAAQLARAAGATVIGTSRSPEKLTRAQPLGVAHGIAVGGDGKFADAVRAASGGEGVPLVIDFVGAAYLDQNLRALAPEGRVVFLGSMGGVSGQLDLGLVLRRRLRLVGSVLRGRPLEQKIAATRACARDVLPLLADRRVRPILDGKLPMSEVAEAHRRMERNDTFGKLVLIP